MTCNVRGRIRATACIVVAWIGAVSCAGFALCFADESSANSPRGADKKAQKPATANLDDELLNDLNNELLKDAGDLRVKGKRPPSQDEPAKNKAGQPGDEPATVDDVSPPDESTDPLVHISDEMRSIEQLLPKSGSRAHAETLQQRVVEDLARLIEQAEAQRARQQSSSQKNKSSSSSRQRSAVKQPKAGAAGQTSQDSNQSAKDSTERLGEAKTARPDAETLKGMMKDSWGHLPPKAREQMLQNSPERFLPQYELLIEKYYQRLAEEQRSN